MILHLIGQEPQLLKEVLAQLELVPDCVLLHLSPDLPCLLAHAFLQEMGHRDMLKGSKALKLFLTELHGCLPRCIFIFV